MTLNFEEMCGIRHGSYKRIIMHEKCGRPDSNGFQLKWRFGTLGNWTNQILGAVLELPAKLSCPIICTVWNFLLTFHLYVCHFFIFYSMKNWEFSLHFQISIRTVRSQKPGLYHLYRIVASTNTCYYSENQLFVQRSQYIRTENPLHKQSEKVKTCH